MRRGGGTTITADTAQAPRAFALCCICPPYGAPDATSEVSRTPGYYRVSAAFAFVGVTAVAGALAGAA